MIKLLEVKILKLFLSVYRLFPVAGTGHGLKSAQEVHRYLQINVSGDIPFEIDDESSVLISPTRDKVIVHRHGKYYQKYATGKSQIGRAHV